MEEMNKLLAKRWVPCLPQSACLLGSCRPHLKVIAKKHPGGIHKPNQHKAHSQG